MFYLVYKKNDLYTKMHFCYYIITICISIQFYYSSSYKYIYIYMQLSIISLTVNVLRKVVRRVKYLSSIIYFLCRHNIVYKWNETEKCKISRYVLYLLTFITKLFCVIYFVTLCSRSWNTILPLVQYRIANVIVTLWIWIINYVCFIWLKLITCIYIVFIYYIYIYIKWF